MGTKIADARHNPRTKQEVFEDLKAGKNKEKVKKEEKETAPKVKRGFDHGLQQSDED
jgi:hypothetical protein